MVQSRPPQANPTKAFSRAKKIGHRGAHFWEPYKALQKLHVKIMCVCGLQSVRVPGLDVTTEVWSELPKLETVCCWFWTFQGFMREILSLASSIPLPIKKLEYRSNENVISCWMVVCKNILCSINKYSTINIPLTRWNCFFFVNLFPLNNRNFFYRF